MMVTVSGDPRTWFRHITALVPSDNSLVLPDSSRGPLRRQLCSPNDMASATELTDDVPRLCSNVRALAQIRREDVPYVRMQVLMARLLATLDRSASGLARLNARLAR